MGYYEDRISERWTATGVGTNAGVTVTKTNATGKRYGALHIACSGDAAAVVTIETPASTILWKKRFAAAFNHSETLPTGCYEAAANASLLVKISASTSNCEANLAGYSIPDASA